MGEFNPLNKYSKSDFSTNYLLGLYRLPSSMVIISYLASSAGVFPLASKAPGSAPYTISSSVCNGCADWAAT